MVGGDYGSLGWAEWLPRQPQGPNLDSSEWVIQVGFFLSPKAATVSLGEVGERVNPQGLSGVFGKGFFTEETLEAGCLVKMSPLSNSGN